LRSDRTVRALLRLLDEKVGKGNYVVALTADHGVCPLPEAARARGKEAGRIDSRLLRSRAAEHLARTFPALGKARGLEAVRWPWVYLDGSLLRRRGLEQAPVERALARWLARQPGIQAAYTRTQLLAGPPADALGRKVRASFHPARSGDVVLIEKPYHLVT